MKLREDQCHLIKKTKVNVVTPARATVCLTGLGGSKGVVEGNWKYQLNGLKKKKDL